MPDWIDDEIERISDLHAAEVTPEQASESVARWWQQLREAIEHDIDRVREHNIKAAFSAPRPDCYEVTNPEFALKLSIAMDADTRTVHFDYRSDSSRTAAPEGGVLTLRTRGHSRIVAFYSDQELTHDRLLRTLLKPVLFPSEPTEEAA